jgi:hypothetical protein
MLLHVIWGFGEDTIHDCPTFSVTGVMLQWSDGSPAHVRQGRFRWQDDAWQATVEVTRAGSSSTNVTGMLRLRPEVSETWTRSAVNPRIEAARQLRDVMHARGWRGDLGVITLK